MTSSQRPDLFYKAHWGVASGIPTQIISESKLITCTGSRISAYNMDGNKSALLTHIPDTILVHSIYLSPNTYNLIASVKLKGDEVEMKASTLFYDVASVFISPSKPKQFQYSTASYVTNKQSYGGQVQKDIYFNNICFSADSSLVAGTLNIDNCGVILFNPYTSTLVRFVEIQGIINGLSISPFNSSKFCVTGNDGMFQYWRLSHHSVNAAPILNLPKRNPNYTSHIWINENRVVAGTASGSLTIVHQCDHMDTVDNVFGTEKAEHSSDPHEDNSKSNIHNKYLDSFSSNVLCILSKGDYIFAASTGQVISIYEIKHTAASGQLTQAASFVALCRYYLTDLNSITSMDWVLKSSLQSYKIYLTGNGVVMQYDLKKFDFSNVVVGTDNWGRINANKAELLELKSERTIFTHHTGSVNCVALSSRTSTIVSASSDDGYVIARDIQYNQGAAQVKDGFIDRREETPLYAALHPSGLFVATATENFVREYAITDTKLEPTKTINMKSHFHSNTGQAVSNTVAPSVVKYSYGGQYLAVVTGKIAQVFHMYNLNYNNSDVIGTPQRLMTVMDHTSVITDIAFSHDDTIFITTDISGCVYSWQVGNSTLRTGDFVMKGAICLKVDINSCALGKQPTIAVIYNSHIDPITISKRMTIRKQSTIVLSKNSLKLDDASQSPMPIASMPTSSKNCIMFWKGALSINPIVVNLEVAPTAVSLGWQAGGGTEICVIGLNDGRVLVSALPMPLMVISTATISSNPIVNYATSNANSAITNADNVKGLDDGTIATIPNSIPNTNSNSSPSSQPQQSTINNEVLDESKCAKLNLHSGRVNSVIISQSGFWAFSAGVDGTVFMLALSSSANNLFEIPEVVNAMENNIIVCEKSQIQTIRAKIIEADNVIEDTKKDCDRLIFKLNESKSATVSELEGRMKRELAKRDVIIVKGRDDLQRLSKQMKEELSKLREKNKSDTAQLEYIYEKKLAQEAIYLDRMRQAYDEFVVHARHNVNDANREYEKKLEAIEQTKKETLAETEKQKKALLLYVDYMHNQHKQMFDSLEERQSDERVKLKEEIIIKEKEKENVEQQSRVKIVKLHTEAHRLKEKVQLTEEESIKLQSDLDWAKSRIDRLESALQTSTSELKVKNDLCSTWEFKVGEMSQQVTELERIRKVLTIQLHAVREEMAPKEEKLTQVSDKLNTTENEYVSSLMAISEKEHQIKEKSESLLLLKKQLGELRRQSLFKDSLLKRLAKIFEDYKWALRQAQYSSTKKPLVTYVDADGNGANGALNSGSVEAANVGTNADGGPGNNSLQVTHPSKSKKVEMVEVISRTDDMEKPLKELDSLLKKFLVVDSKHEGELLDEAEKIREETERHHEFLQSGLIMLQGTLAANEKVFDSKVYNHLKDNQKLLDEVNFLRKELRGMSMENQRLIASSEHVERQNKKLIHKLNSALLWQTNQNFKDKKEGKVIKKTAADDLNNITTNIIHDLSQPSVGSQASRSLGSRYSRQASPPDSPDPDKINYDPDEASVNPDTIIDAMMEEIKGDTSVFSNQEKSKIEVQTINDSVGLGSKIDKSEAQISNTSNPKPSSTVSGNKSYKEEKLSSVRAMSPPGASRLMDIRASSSPIQKRPVLAKSESQPLPVNKTCFEDFFTQSQEKDGYSTNFSGQKSMSLADEKILALIAQNEQEIRRKAQADNKKITMPTVKDASIAETEVSAGSAAEILKQYQTVYTGGSKTGTDGLALQTSSSIGKFISGNDFLTVANDNDKTKRPHTSGIISTSKSAASLTTNSRPNNSNSNTNSNNNSVNNRKVVPAGSKSKLTFG